MKRKILQITTVALLLIATITTCKKETPDANGIMLDQPKLEILAGETATLKATLIPKEANNTVTWETSDPNVATVNKGTVTGMAFGTATITATSHNGHTAKCDVTVIQILEPEMIWVEGGTFTMGCTDEEDEECSEDSKPAHKVTLSGFYIAKYETTQKVWVAAMGTNPSYSGENYTGEDKPVHILSWNNVQEYISKLNAYTGKNYRLPTEAEWEYAARGGKQSKGYKYSGSSDFDEVGWFNAAYPHNVGEKKPNELGIYDMCGNVWEYCSDWYDYYTDEPQINPAGAPNGSFRIIRGGGWYTTQPQTVSMRQGTPPAHPVAGSGFRLVLPAE